MSWTDERVELLKKLWTDGLSASQIAGELGGITRNAVIGKVHRLGLSGRAKRLVLGAAAAQAALPHDAGAARRRCAATPRWRSAYRDGSRARAGADRERHPDRAAPHHPRIDRRDLPLADRRSRQRRSSSSAAASRSPACPTAPITRASPTSRRTGADGTAARRRRSGRAGRPSNILSALGPERCRPVGGTLLTQTWRTMHGSRRCEFNERVRPHLFRRREPGARVVSIGTSILDTVVGKTANASRLPLKRSALDSPRTASAFA